MTEQPARSRKSVVNIIATVLSSLDHVGIAVEPITLMSDPDDDIEGDYTFRVCFQKNLADGRFFVSVFQGFFPMDKMQRLGDKHLIMNMESIIARAKEHRDTSLDDCDGVVTRDKLVNIGDIVKKASDELKG